MLRTGVCVEWPSRLRHSVTSEGYQVDTDAVRRYHMLL